MVLYGQDHRIPKERERDSEKREFRGEGVILYEPDSAENNFTEKTLSRLLPCPYKDNYEQCVYSVFKINKFFVRENR